ncbi:hypothetical protein INN71_12255 [Nocardioides sp. ChNu-153]|uniref:hypothetical protein n=1 Tax=Nocardioides sp. ChNu-153 TaxID=2779364 RepID=UPI00264E12CA|nr:hypothetical protein [Nocardioides sp. ChNu-153]MDN7122162.1 hypothetical protein [Nocardioides sp. ChNu-153]
MTTTGHDGAVPDPDHDQDAEPSTPTGEEPDTDQLEPGSEPASHPDPEPGNA